MDTERFRGYIQRALKLFKNLKFTAGIIALLITLYFLGLVLPQKWMFATLPEYETWLDESVFYRLMDMAGFTSIYDSPVTLTLLGLFFINLLVVLTSRVPIMLKRAFIGELPSLNPDAIKTASVERLEIASSSASCLDGAGAELKRAGFKVLAAKENTLFAVKNQYSPLGFILFHASFLLCLLAALMIFYTRFSGKLTLTEGQSFDGDIAQFHRISSTPRFFEALPSLGLKLDSVNVVYEDDVTSRLEADVQVFYDNQTKQERLNVNKPIKRDALTILANSFGISPLFQVVGPEGQELDAAYVALNVLNSKVDSFKMSDETYNFTVLFYPDFEMVDGLPRTRSVELNNPVFNVQIAQRDNIVYDGYLKPGREVQFKHLKLRVLDIKYWVEFIVVREYGMWPMTIGFILGAIGLVMRLVLFQQRISMFVEPAQEGSVIYISGKSDYFPHTFAVELKEMAAKLNKRLSEEPG